MINYVDNSIYSNYSNTMRLLTEKQAKFLASYQLTNSTHKAALNAGYSEKTAAQAGSRLLNNVKVLTQLNSWRVKKGIELSKGDFVEMAVTDYKAVTPESGNRPRYLEIAGKALGYLGNDQPSSPTFNQINVNILTPRSIVTTDTPTTYEAKENDDG